MTDGQAGRQAGREGGRQALAGLAAEHSTCMPGTCMPGTWLHTYLACPTSTPHLPAALPGEQAGHAEAAPVNGLPHAGTALGQQVGRLLQARGMAGMGTCGEAGWRQ